MLIASYGGGVNSTAMLIWMLENGHRPDHILFADTGAEHPGTLAYVERFRRWLSQHQLDITIVKSELGSIVSYCEQAGVIPSRLMRWCTDKFKIRPLRKFLKANCPVPVRVAVGFDAGEGNRAQGRRSDSIQDMWFPLIEENIDRDGCMEIIKSAGLCVPRKSGCWFCPHQRIARWEDLKKEHPELWDRAVALERVAMKTNSAYTFVGSRPGAPSLEQVMARRYKGETLFDDSEGQMPCACYDG